MKRIHLIAPWKTACSERTTVPCERDRPAPGPYRAAILAVALAASLGGCGVDAMTAAATVATLQAKQIRQTKAQETKVLDGFKAAQEAERMRVARPEVSE